MYVEERVPKFRDGSEAGSLSGGTQNRSFSEDAASQHHVLHLNVFTYSRRSVVFLA